MEKSICIGNHSGAVGSPAPCVHFWFHYSAIAKSRDVSFVGLIGARRSAP